MFITSLFVLISCSKENPSVIIPTKEQIVPITALPAGWKIAEGYMTNFPSGIQLFYFDSLFNGQKMKAFCLAYDSRNTNFEFKPVQSTVAKTPSAFFSEEPGVTYACINGGYFGGTQSYSLVKYNNLVLSPNIKSVTRTYNGTNTSYYPTRAAFGFNSTSAPSVAWIYHVGTGNDVIYSYPAPSPNELNTPPQPSPSESFPAGGTLWNTTTAIGGSPVLVKNNSIQISDKEELISINNSNSRPRSAIGYLTSGIVLLMVVEGDNAPNYPGINLPDMAAMLKSFNCFEAINLDGGGSTSMVVGGTRTVRPGDNGTERPVISAVIIKKKQ
jgi:hypothetical protein